MTRTKTETEVDVVIIGAGPVGCVLANLLGLQGIRTLVLDRAEAGYHLPRAVVFDDEIMRVFQLAGLADEISATTEVGGDARFVDGTGRVLVHWDRPMRRTENGWYLNNRFHQPTLEDQLRAGFDRFECVEIAWGTEVTALEQSPDAATLTCRTQAGRRKVRAGYVVGCDGGRSFTRSAIGAENQDLGFHEPWLIVDLLLREPDPDPDPHTYHYCGTMRMGSQVYVGRHRKRWEFRLNPGDDPETIGSAENVWEMLSEWIGPDRAILERTALYTFHSTIARPWGRGRAFIAGDAAHQTPPFMGQGMCAGIRDASNLAWKLGRVLRHDADTSLLNTYEGERSPHVRAFIDLTINLGRLINRTAEAITTGDASALKDGSQHMTLIRPRLGPGLQAGDAARRGELFPQVTLATGKTIDDAVGYDPMLICGPAADLSPGVSAEFENTGIAVIRDDGPETTDWLRSAGAVAVLVRPDRAVLGTVDSAARIAELLPAAWRIETVT